MKSSKSPSLSIWKGVLLGIIFLVGSNLAPNHVFAASKSVLIGDSQTQYIKNKITKPIDVPIAVVGINVSGLADRVGSYETPDDKDVEYVFVCVGVNNLYKFDGSEDRLVQNLQETFPKAKLYVIPGSYGWEGVKNTTPDDITKYYSKWSGVTILGPGIGGPYSTAEVHSQLGVYTTIANQIDGIISASSSGGGGGGDTKTTIGDPGKKTTTTIGDPGKPNPVTADTDISSQFQVKNPIGSGTTDMRAVLDKILNSIVTLLTPVLVLMLVYSGYLFVAGRGNTEKLTDAKKVLTYTLIGTVIVVAASGIAHVIENTISVIIG